MIASVKNGFRLALQRKRIALLFYGTNLAFGLVVMLPFHVALRSFAGGTVMAESLATRVDMDFLAEFFHANATTLPSVYAALALAGAANTVINLFLSGGAYAVFLHPEADLRQTFWSGAGNYAGRFIRLGLWSVIPFGVLYLAQFLVPLAVRIIYGSDPYQSVEWWANCIRTAIGLGAIILYFIV